MVADRFIEARRRGWQQHDDKGRLLRRTMGIAALGGATLDNEENYLIKKLFTAAGAVQIENQARICPPLFPVWEPRSGVVAPRKACRTWPTLTASSFRVPTWPSAIRWASSGWRKPGRAGRR
jgi:hypothetical protein